MEPKEPVIVLFAAYPHYKDGVWRTSGVDDPGDHAGATFDRFRVLAVSWLAERYPKSLIIVSSGAQHHDTPSGAAVSARELAELGVAKKRMLLEERSQSVHQQLHYIGCMALEKRLGPLLVVTNDWHLPRLKAMVEYAPNVGIWKEVIWEPIGAEQVMLESENKEWQNMVVAERAHPKYRERLAMEEQGVRQVKEGTYRYKSL